MSAATIIHAMGGTYPEHARHEYSATRFPYTYACDFLRLAGIADSRGEASSKLREFCAGRDIDPEVAFIALAYAYMNHYGIVKP